MLTNCRKAGAKVRVLVVDDDPYIAELIAVGFNLQWREIEVLGAQDGKTALDMVEQKHPDMVLLDITLPGINGYETLRQLREFSDVPVIMLSARDALVDKVKGLELGADDYVTKPFEPLELLARTKSLMRRLGMPRPLDRSPSFRYGELAMDFASQQVRLRGEPVALTVIEYKLLYHLVRNAGRVLSHKMLLARLWGDDRLDEINYLRVYIWRLRHKLEDNPRQPRYIVTEHGLGYRFQE